MRAARFVTLWEFQARPQAVAAFEEIYGANGAWAQLFRQSPDFLGTELVRDPDRAGRYLTLDHWTSREALRRFKQDHHADYAALDKQCESLTAREVLLGDFEQISILRRPTKPSKH